MPHRFIKNDMFMHLLCIYKKPINLSLFKNDTLNFKLHHVCFNDFDMPFKNIVNLTSMNIFFTIDQTRSQVFFVIVKRKPKSTFHEH